MDKCKNTKGNPKVFMRLIGDLDDFQTAKDLHQDQGEVYYAKRQDQLIHNLRDW